jgi:hypothetical protein
MTDIVDRFNFFEYHTVISHDNIILSYKGPLTDTLLSELSKDVREKFDKNRKTGKKVFSIFMELAQNVLYYSREYNHFGSQDKVGKLVVAQTDQHYELITGNLVLKTALPILVEKCNIVNSLNREELREYKRNLRNAPSEEESKGAGIGLVQVALTSDNNIRTEIRELRSDYAFFIVSAFVQKEILNT